MKDVFVYDKLKNKVGYEISVSIKNREKNVFGILKEITQQFLLIEYLHLDPNTGEHKARVVKLEDIEGFTLLSAKPFFRPCFLEEGAVR